MPRRFVLSLFFCLLLLPMLFAAPGNVACLDSSLAQLWKVAGGEVSITVGESITRGIVDHAILVNDTAGMKIDKEILIASKPDFVIGSSLLSSHTSLSNVLSCPYVFYDIDSFGAYLSALKELTDITGRADLYKQYGSDEQATIDAVIRSAEGRKGPKVLIIRAGVGASLTKALGTEDHFAAGILKDLGADNIADRRTVLTDTLSPETILAESPDMILVILKGDEVAARQYIEGVFASSVWKSIKAIRNGKVVFLDRDLFHYKPIGNWDKAYKTMFEVLYE